MLIECEEVVSGGCALSETVQRKGYVMARDKNITVTINKERRLQKELNELAIKNEEIKSDLDNANYCLSVYAKENEELKHQISELESELRVKEDLFKIKGAISGEQPSAEWYEQRYQSDCITINQLHTTIDVLTDKLARLREVKGL